MKPSEQWCPKCGAFPINVTYKDAISEEEARRNHDEYQEHKKDSLTYAFLALPRLERSVAREARIDCSCPRCSYKWKVKPLDADIKHESDK